MMNFLLVDLQQKDVEPVEKDNMNKAAALYKFLGIQNYIQSQRLA